MEINYKEFYRVIGKAFIKAFQWNIGKWVITVGIGILTSVVIPIGKEIFEWNYVTALITAGSALVILYLIRFFLIAIKETIKYFHEVYKNSAYGDAIIYLKDSFAEAHYYRKTPGFQENEFIKSMIIFCNNLKIIFDKITHSDCSVSIKVPVTDSKVTEGSVLKNLTRDKEHKGRDTNQYNDIKHTIIGNSAFNNCLNKVISNQQSKFYLNNDVNNSTNYLNTSIACYDDGKLPYNSEIVYPITPIKSLDNENFDCHGFICIDSDKKGVFDEKYSVAIIEGVADGIYDIILELNSSENEYKNQN